MLTPKDICDPSRRSGFKHVGCSAQTPTCNHYKAQVGASSASAAYWRGPRRRTPEEAAQDYCDYVNSAPLTIEDIRNPARSSGFNFVRLENWPGRQKPYAASAQNPKYKSGGGLPAYLFSGPHRATAEEAAQDYCDWHNSQRPSNPSLPGYAPVKVDMGNTKRHAPKPEKVIVTRTKYKGPHDLYDVLFTTANGDIVCRKAGITARGHARYADVCKTLGMSIRPVVPAVTFPSEEAARLAETARVAEIAQDPAWRRVGKESFAPINPAAQSGGTTQEVTTTS